MTKRKNSRQKHQKEASFADTSDEELTQEPQGKCCQHVTRAIHFGRIKKALKTTQSIQSCSTCTVDDAGEELPEVWLCLQCGNRGCGRASENKHALQHFKTIHSDCHSLVLSTLSGIVWCYDCDDAVSLRSSRILKQCVDFVSKASKNVNDKTNFPNSVNNVQEINEEAPEQSLEKAENCEKNMKTVKNIKDSPKKVSVKGLRNLGNTCFFNAVMQNLNQTPLLIHELTNTCTPSHVWEIPELDVDNEVITMEETENLKLSLPQQMQLTNTLLNFFHHMSAKGSSKLDVVNPSDLFSEISKKCPQFRHFQEQDSHELLRQLLDNVRQEEIKRQKKALLRHFELENVNPENVDDYTKERIKAYRSYASHTIIEKVFGGLLISTVLCEECKLSSQIFEPFMDLSLPLFEEKPVRNRKSDEDDDSHFGYVLPKPKYDSGKISKHQEKKQKQLAKKERKMNRGAKNKKLSLSNIEDSENIAPGPVSDTLEQASEVAVIEDQVAENSQNEEKLSSTDSTKVNFESSTDERSFADFRNIDDDDVDFPSTSILNFENSYSEKSGEDLSLSGNINAVNDDIETQISKDTCNDNLEETGTLSLSDSNTDNPLADDFKKFVPSETNLNGKDLDKDNFDIKLNSIPESLTTVPQNNDAISELSEVLNNCEISIDSSLPNLDDRIQALSMQIKDVRIRRDSDRQEILLNSSESADENESQRTLCTSSKSSVEDLCLNKSSDNWSHSVSEQQTKEWILKSLTTLKPRHNASALECSIRSCLSHFTKPELLTGNNKFRCENCTEMKMKKSGNKKEVVYTNASKQILIFSPPAVLTLHLKRFQQVGMSLRKVNRFVEFPLVLDLAPFCSSASVILPHMSSVEHEILYSLYGIVEHSGRLTSGHYTAYVKASNKMVHAVYECLVPLGQSNFEQLLQRFSGVHRSSHSLDCDQCKEEKAQWFYISDSHVKEVSEAQVLKCQAYLLFYERIK